MLPIIHSDDPRLQLMTGGWRDWWDTVDQRLVRVLTLYVSWGCPDYGNTKQGERIPHRCVFCGLPSAATSFNQSFYGKPQLSSDEHFQLFRSALTAALHQEMPHTVNVFNAGSFIAMPVELQMAIVRELAQYPIVGIVADARARLITPSTLSRLMEILVPRNIRLTLRIGVETKDERMRNDILGKGHSPKEISTAVAAMKELRVIAGAYALLKPGPVPWLDDQGYRREAVETIRWLVEDMEFDEVYFRAGCVPKAPKTKLYSLWESGGFAPATLWETMAVLRMTATKFPGKVHLLPFADEPPFVAIPSADNPRGIPESLEGASDLDKRFYELFQLYRLTMDPSVLTDPSGGGGPS
jgi:archaeosine synthase beta-subunit